MVRVTSVALQAGGAHSAPGLGTACLLLAGVWLSACPPAPGLINTNGLSCTVTPAPGSLGHVLSSGLSLQESEGVGASLACHPGEHPPGEGQGLGTGKGVAASRQGLVEATLTSASSQPPSPLGDLNSLSLGTGASSCPGSSP